MTQQSSKCTRYVFESLLVNWRMSFALFVMRFVQTLRSIALTFSKVEPEACIYGSPYFPISVRSPALASFIAHQLTPQIERGRQKTKHLEISHIGLGQRTQSATGC